MTTTSTKIKIRYFNDFQIFNTETRSVEFFGDDIVSAVEHVMGKDLLGGIDLSANPLPASYTPATGIAVCDSNIHKKTCGEEKSTLLVQQREN